MKAFILAGGFATRLWPLTEKRAKPLLPLAGKPLLDHLIEKIPESIPVTVSTNAVFSESFEKWKKDSEREDIEIIIEETSRDDHKLGALGAVASWLSDKKIDDDVLLLTGDNYFGCSIENFLKAASPNTTVLAAHDIGNKELARSFGTILLNADGKSVIGFEEKPEQPKSTLISTGCSILPKNVHTILKEFAKDHPDNVGGIFEELLRQDKSIHCFTFREPWFDIGSFEAYLEATKVLVGESIVREEGADDVDSKLEGSVVLGRGSRIRNSTCKNVVVFENCLVEDCVLEDCILDDHCSLKGIDLRGKMIREGTNLSQKK